MRSESTWLTKLSKQLHVGHDGILVAQFLHGGRHGRHVPTTCLGCKSGIQNGDPSAAWVQASRHVRSLLP